MKKQKSIKKIKGICRGDYQSPAGITLMVLVVTIIVLLILSGVAINLAIKDGSILGEAKEAVNNWKNITDKEEEELLKLANKMKELKNATNSGDSENNGGEDNKTENTISVSEAKSTINSSNIQSYIGKEVEYNSTKGGTWRVFYYDEEGYFGKAKTVYLKRDYDSINVAGLSKYKIYNSSDNGAIMKKMNPKWASSSYSTIDLENEYCVSWLCDPEIWKEYKTNNSSYAIGSPSVEMYMKAFNQWKDNNTNSTTLINKIDGANGYSVGVDGKYTNSGDYTGRNTIESGPNNIFMTSDKSWWLASPSKTLVDRILAVSGGSAGIYSIYDTNTNGVCPIVPLDQ